MPWDAEDTELAYIDYLAERDGAFGGDAWGDPYTNYGYSKESEMPRQVESQEAKILSWVRTAPLEVVRVVLGLSKAALKEREGVGGLPKHLPLPKAHAAASHAKPKSHHRQAATGGAHNWTSPHAGSGKAHAAAGGHKPTGKKRSHHKRPRPTNGAEGAEVEEFGAGGE